jgi:hypothetical protein
MNWPHARCDNRWQRIRSTRLPIRFWQSAWLGSRNRERHSLPRTKGCAFARQKWNRKAARAHFLEALRINPENRRAQNGLAWSRLTGVRIWAALLTGPIVGAIFLFVIGPPNLNWAILLLVMLAVAVILGLIAAGLLWIRDSLRNAGKS